jgi:hypothetical protein
MTTIADLPEKSRVWVFAANRPLAPDDEARLTAVLDKAFGVWAKKAPEARGVYEFREGRFLVVGADERGACVSGCGIDAMMQWMKQLEAESGLRLVDRMQVFWRDADGVVQSARRDEFARRIDAGEVTRETHVFDTAAATSDAFRAGRFELPLGESWHAQVFSVPAAAEAAR